MSNNNSIRNDIFSRINDLFETDVLKEKLVSIIGLGSGGSLSAIELAKCGVGRFYLADYDRLEIQNVARHACGIRDIGRYKTVAVKDAILNINPEAEVNCFNVDITKDISILKKIIGEADILLPCIDTERSKYQINQFCMKLWNEERVSIPAIYAGVYERAFGGDVMRVIPGETPCYDCVIGSVQQATFSDSKPKGPVPYSDLESSEGFKAEPGLGLDLHFIALIQAKLSLLTLLRGTDSQLEDIPYNFILWGNRKEWIFKEPFKCVFANIEKRENCPTCAKWETLENDLGMTRNQIEKEAKKILNQIPEIDPISSDNETR